MFGNFNRVQVQKIINSLYKGNLMGRNTNEVEEIAFSAAVNATKAEETLKLLLNQLIQVEKKLLDISRR